MTQLPVAFIVKKNLWNAGIWLEKHWTNRVIVDSASGKYIEKYSIKQRNCAYRASNLGYVPGDLLVTFMKSLHIDARKWILRSILDQLSSLVLYGAFLLFTDGMHFQNLDPTGLLEICDEIDAEKLA